MLPLLPLLLFNLFAESADREFKVAYNILAQAVGNLQPNFPEFVGTGFGE